MIRRHGVPSLTLLIVCGLSLASCLRAYAVDWIGQELYLPQLTAAPAWTAPVFRMTAVAAHLAVVILIAAILRRQLSAPAGVFAAALVGGAWVTGSVVTHAGGTVLLVICAAALACSLWLAGARSLQAALGALTLITLSALALSSIQTPWLPINGWIYSLQAICAVGAGALVDKLGPWLHTRPRTAALAAVIGLSAAAMGWLNTAAWLGMLEQASGVSRAALSAAAMPANALVLNAPNTLRMQSDVPGLPDTTYTALPFDALPAVTRAQLIEGEVQSPGAVNAFLTSYGPEQPRWTQAEAIEAAKTRGAVWLGASRDQLYTLDQVGGLSRTRPAQLAARFTQGGNTIELWEAAACRSSRLRVSLRLRRVSGDAPTAKFFRHALHDSEQLLPDDTELLGGLMRLSTLPSDRDMRDIRTLAVPDPARVNAVRVGIYDWQTGARWEAFDAAGQPLPDNALIFPVQDGAERCE